MNTNMMKAIVLILVVVIAAKIVYDKWVAGVV